MKRLTQINIYLLAIIMLSYSCVQNENIQSGNNPLAKINEYISSPAYLQVCKKINPSVGNVQVNYKGLVPGKTKENEIIPLVGEPNEITRVNEKTTINGETKLIEDQWGFDTFNFTIENGVINDIDVYDESFIYNSLINIIKEYGCPNIIFAVDIIDTTDESYDPGEAPLFTLLKFQNIGLELFFGKYPVPITDSPERITLRRPETLQDFLSRMSIFQSNVGINGIVSWDNAIIQEP